MIRRQIILAISMVFLVLAVCSAATAADVSSNGTQVQAQDQVAGHNSTGTNSVHASTTNTNSSQASTTNTDSKQTNTAIDSSQANVTEQTSNQSSDGNGSAQINATDQPSKVVISGKVKTCSSGDPFSGVTVTAKKNGTTLASTTTDENGTYTLEFQSDDNDFIVTASYPGHTSSSKEVTVNPDANGTLQGSADFQLGPADGDTYVFNGWAVDPNQVITFPDGTMIDGNDPAAFDNIADAVNAATAGRTVYIADGAGPYIGANNRGITINKNLNIVGESQAGTVINAGGLNNIFTILAGNTVTIQDLTLTDGSAGFGGAIFNLGTLTVTDVTFNDNSGSSGGAIANFGTLTVTESTFNFNTANIDGGAIFNQGGLTVNDSSFETNSAIGGRGGAIFNQGGLTVNDSLFGGNTANSGGAIFNSGILGVTGSDFISNVAPFGGAIYNDDGTLTVTESTFDSNTAAIGGAIFNSGGLGNVHFNRIVGNSPANSEIFSEGGVIDATLNWWGSNSSPAGKISTGPGGVVLFDPWLVLTITANPSVIFNGGTSQVTADLLHDSNGVFHDPALGHVPDGIPITLTIMTWGSFTNPGNTDMITLFTVNGSVTATYFANEGPTPQPPLNPVEITATADDETVSTFITILTPPSVITIGAGTSILGPSQNQAQNQAQTQTQTSINTNTNNLTNDNVNVADSASISVNINNITNANIFNPVIILGNLNST